MKESLPRVGPGRRLFFLRMFFLRQCAGAVADQLRGHLGATGLASARGGGALTIFLSNPRARGKQPPSRRLFFFCGILFAAGGGGVAAELWGRVGSSGLASARVGRSS